MALSRAAAAAARKAAKNRGLQGNRAKDGSLTTLEDIGFTGKEGAEMRAAGYHDKQPAMLMEDEIPLLTDGELNKAYVEAHEVIAELQELGAEMQESNWVGFDIEKYNTQMNRAKERLSMIEDEFEARGVSAEDVELGILDVRE